MLLDGKDVWESLAARPSLILEENPQLVPYWVAFWKLSRTRKKIATMSVVLHEAIDFKEIESYCRLYGIVDYAMLAEHVDRMDSLWLSTTNGKLIEKANKPTGRPR